MKNEDFYYPCVVTSVVVSWIGTPTYQAIAHLRITWKEGTDVWLHETLSGVLGCMVVRGRRVRATARCRV